MEEIFAALKTFLLGEFNRALALHEDGRALLPRIQERAISFGAVDPLKTPGDTLCAFLPESIEPLAGYISGRARGRLKLSLCFWCRGAGHEELVRRACRYAECLSQSLAADPSLGGKCLDCGVAGIEFDWDCGVADRAAAASVIDIEAQMEE